MVFLTSPACEVNEEDATSQGRPLIGLLALQGAVHAHARHLVSCGARTRRVRLPSDLEGLDGIVLPGGESTVIAALLDRSGLRSPLQEHLRAGLPVLATCAGLILLSREIRDPARNDRPPLEICDISVRRNWYGRQIDSFERDLLISFPESVSMPGGEAVFERTCKRLPGIPAYPSSDQPSFRAVFIRAPGVVSWGEGIRVLAWHNEQPVMLRDRQALMCTFHPELTDDDRVHRLFLEQVAGRLGERS